MNTNYLILLAFLALTNCKKEIQTFPEEKKSETATTFIEGNTIEVEIHARVNTANKEIEEIATLWTNYLNSQPDEITDNPFWNEEEKALYRDFDLSRNLLYPFPAGQLLRHYKPKILSIEKEGEHYAIRTLYAAEGLEGDYRKSNPWAIQKLYAVQENNAWKLKNALPVITANWNKKTVGKITFIYPPQHEFNQELAEKANRFCNQLTEEFDFPEWEPFDFYITQSGDELGRLLNFDFFFAGYTTGIGLNEKRMLLSGAGSEYFPHEFVHLIVPKFERHALIEEGFATWNGGQSATTFEESARLLANELAKNDSVTFTDVLTKKWGWQHAAFYTTGAILCDAAYKKGGVQLVNKLLKIPAQDDQLLDALSEILEVDKKDFDHFWRQEVVQFKDH